MERVRLSPVHGGTYRQIGIYSWGRGVIENSPITGAELSKVTYYRFPAGALLLSNIQAWEAAIAVSEEHHAEQFVASQRFLPYVPVDIEEVSTRYLLHFFLSDPGMALIRKASPGTVTRNGTLGMKAFEDLLVALPDFDEQRRIAARLDGLAMLAQTVAGAGPGRSEREKAFRERMIYGDLVDEETYESKRGDLLMETADVVPLKADTKYPTVGMRNRGRGLFVGPVLTDQSTKYRTLRRLHAGQVIYSKLKAFEGAIFVVPECYDGFFTSHEFPTFTAQSHVVDAGYLRNVFMTQHFTELLADSSKGVGARRERLSPEAFLALPVPVPSIEAQRRIAAQLSDLQTINELSARQQLLADALPQAARNEVFSQLV
jgi:type I restriction enzyme S subunit